MHQITFEKKNVKGGETSSDYEYESSEEEFKFILYCE